MKTSTKLNRNGIKVELILFLAMALVIFAGKANAQGYRSGFSGLYVGVEVTNSNRSSKITSDLPSLKGLKLALQGKTYGITVGNRLIHGKIRFGNFSVPTGDNQPIQSNTFELGSNFSPLQLIAKRTPILEPYLSVSMETTKIKTGGTFTPPAAKPKASTCSCECPSSGAAMADPDALPITKPVPFSGSFGSTRANFGVGLKAHVQKGKLFLTVYGEMNYGVTLGTTASTQALLNTYVLNQTSFSAGVSIGFIYTKSAGRRLHRVSFR